MAWLPSCSRNAHDRNVLVRRAQLRINQAMLPQRNLRLARGGGEERASLEGAFIFGERRQHGPTAPRSARPLKGLARRLQLDQRVRHSLAGKQLDSMDHKCGFALG